jgi:hypothetical protein
MGLAPALLARPKFALMGLAPALLARLKFALLGLASASTLTDLCIKM